MRNLLKTIKYIFYRFISKKTLITIIFCLLTFILFNNKTVFGAFIGTSTTIKPNPIATNNVFKNVTKDSDGFYKVGETSTNCDTYIIFIENNGSGYIYYFYNSNCYYNNSQLVFTGTTSNNLFYYSVDSSNNVSYFSQIKSLSTGDTWGTLIYAEKPIYYQDGSLFYSSQTYNEPYISQSDSELSSLTIPYISLYGGSVPASSTISLFIDQVTGSDSTNRVFTLVLNNQSTFFNEGTNGNYFYKIPVGLFRNELVTNNNYYFRTYWSDGQQDFTTERLILYTGVINQETANQEIIGGITDIRQHLQEQIEISGNISQQQQEQTEILKDTNQFLKDDSFNSGDLNIPTDNTQDITEDGINNIFTQIYNGFTSGVATDIVIPIPFTNKTITINSNLTSNILNSNGFGWLKTIIEAFWWYIISVFIVKDISKKINKIKSGDFENIETNNIKEDML